jgi:dimethylhistidine N-methyltransferase
MAWTASLPALADSGLEGIASASLDFARDLRAALRAHPRTIAPKWFYDARGSALFDRICELPEYYPTRTELALLRRCGREIAQRFGARAEVVEFGAGSSVKIRLLLEHLQAPGGFVPVDISGEHLERCAASLRRDFPGLAVTPVVADYTNGLDLPAPGGPRVGFWPGSSIGNFEPETAVCLLRRMSGWLDGGPMLVGLDLVKDPARLHAAYNDAQGVTAAFNRNLLERARRELDADLDPQGFAHYAFWNPQQRRIEMHLQSRGEQTIALLGEHYRFEDGQTLHTENSYKYTRERFTALAANARLAVDGWWSDGDMALAWLRAS